MNASAQTTCPHCQKPVLATARFCMECGGPIGPAAGSPTIAASANTMSGTDGGVTEAERQIQLQQLLAEATIGEFEILGELGRGGMATVYLAHDLPLDRKVAIKVIAPGLLTTPGAAERFKREARTAASLSHPHIIPIHAVRETPNLLYFVMKFVAGRPLDDIIRERGRLPIRMIQAILIEVGQALAYAHRHAIVHRDIKPANVMIDSDGWAMVTDFGIAKVLESDALTVSGAMIGTPYYMSPEQCSGKPVAGSSDQYSLGVVAYEMLTGHPPFSGDTIMEIMKGHFFEAPAPVEAARPDCPRALAMVVARMLAKEPVERFESMDEAVVTMDAAPLAADDPVRGEMIALARSSGAIQLLSKLSVPVSPIPRGWSRARPVAATGGREAPPEPPPEPEAEPEPPPRARWKTALGVIAAVAVFAGSGAAAALYLRPALKAPPPPVVDTSTAIVAESVVAVPAESVPEPAAPKEAAEQVAARRDRAMGDYVQRIQQQVGAEWIRVDRGSLEVGRDARARFQLEINSSGTEENISDPGSGPLDRAAFTCLSGMRFPPLPSALGQKSLRAWVTFTLDGVLISPI